MATAYASGSGSPFAGVQTGASAPASGGFSPRDAIRSIPTTNGYTVGQGADFLRQSFENIPYVGTGGANQFLDRVGIPGGSSPQPPAPSYGTPPSYDPNTNYYGLAALYTAQNQYAPQRALQQQIIDQAAGRLNPNSPEMASFGLDRSHLNTNYGLDSRLLGIQQQALGVDQAANNRQSGFIEGNRSADVNEMNRKAAYDQFNQRDQAIAHGAAGSEGYRQDLANTEAGRAYDVGRTDRTAAEEQAKVRDRTKTLNLQAAKLGIDADRLKSELQYGLDRLGLSQSITTDDLTDKLNSARMQDQVFAQQIFDRALQLTPIYQQMQFLPPGYQAALHQDVHDSQPRYGRAS